MKNLEGKIVFITGASSGIGKSCATEFAKLKANLILTARREDRLKDLAKELEQNYKIKTLCLKLDVRKFEDVESLYNNLSEDWKKVDILVNNAGLARGLDKFYAGKLSDWNEMIDTNIKGLLNVSRVVVPQMVERQTGHIINIGSTAGHETYTFGNVYSATKFAVKALSQSFRLDVLDKSIKVSSVDPGMVYTEFSKVRFSGDIERADNVYKGITPLSPDDVAEAVLFCATRPDNVNINEIILTPVQQASSSQVYRKN
ncbi:MAG TPA: SDR family NAD(P)-dependent oxidoreductase [Ignavibacteriaceae bacterium]|jgi:serine 3-dehydrogenase|nr:MAG: NADP-dependent 3-hydroxy acid dehydrogenase YdfG [Ignavibacteria bacterium ADurb.Bin266]OQY71603.1 MAG: NAD(P)-dependent oxidoreductase [Ignavibacteriales bacterium UTCHB2]HQF42181.1 SDR family NAD(P)-dependent oxidoreductase [Ignavibacteriaceae bacterium]HQI41443.1 SDR family NAD(P)-dependent oxidoreductase [Ignavibacteriaceae bacterium]HQJ46553.1 SDR family NAD(P)-dependent oxidoreductase [Ignavibacteriaceae bacterium]